MAITMAFWRLASVAARREPFVECRARPSAPQGRGRLARLTLITFLWFVYMQGFDFWRHEYGSMRSVAATLGTGLLFSASVASFGMAVTILLGSNRWSSQAVVMISAPAVFYLGRHLAHDERAERACLRALALHSDLARSACALLRPRRTGPSPSPSFPIGESSAFRRSSIPSTAPISCTAATGASPSSRPTGPPTGTIEATAHAVHRFTQPSQQRRLSTRTATRSSRA